MRVYKYRKPVFIINGVKLTELPKHIRDRYACGRECVRAYGAKHFR